MNSDRVVVSVLLAISLIAGLAAGYFYAENGRLAKEARTARQDSERLEDELTQLRGRIDVLESASGLDQPTTAEGVDGDGQAAPARSENIILLSPRPGENISPPMYIAGKARTFEGNVVVRLKDSEGRLIKKTFTTANMTEPGQFGDFKIWIEFEPPDSGAGTLELFEHSAEDGTEINKVTVPLEFSSE